MRKLVCPAVFAGHSELMTKLYFVCDLIAVARAQPNLHGNRCTNDFLPAPAIRARTEQRTRLTDSEFKSIKNCNILIRFSLIYFHSVCSAVIIVIILIIIIGRGRNLHRPFSRVSE